MEPSHPQKPINRPKLGIFILPLCLFLFANFTLNNTAPTNAADLIDYEVRESLANSNSQSNDSVFIRISVGLNGDEANGWSGEPSLSADGRYITFSSDATNLIANDTNNQTDIFVFDMATEQIERVSIASDGTEANYYSAHPTISMNGRYIAFASEASNLVLNDTNGLPDFFVHDRQTKLTTRVSLSSSGNEAYGSLSSPALSSDGRFIAFASDSPELAGGANAWMNLYVYDQQIAYLQPVSATFSGEATNGTSAAPSISGDGNQIVFSSLASNLIRGDNNGLSDIFIFNSATSTTELVSTALQGSMANGHSYSPDISSDGRYVVFTSDANNLVEQTIYGASAVFIRDRQTDQTWPVSEPNEVTNLTSEEVSNFPPSALASISADGHYVTFYRYPYYTYPLLNADIPYGYFIYDVLNHDIFHVANIYDDDSGNEVGKLSANGRFLVFSTRDNTLVSNDVNDEFDIFLYENIAFHPLELHVTITPTIVPSNMITATFSLTEQTIVATVTPINNVSDMENMTPTVPLTVTPIFTPTPTMPVFTQPSQEADPGIGIYILLGFLVIGVAGLVALLFMRRGLWFKHSA